MSIVPDRFSPISPTKEDVEVAKEATSRIEELIAKLAKKSKGKGFDRIKSADLRLDSDHSDLIHLPPSLVRIVAKIIREMAEGKAIAIVPYETELTTEEAAQILNVSRPFVSKLVNEGKLPPRKVGRNRRIRLDDLLAYKRKDDEAREKALAELTAMSQELDMGY